MGAEIVKGMSHFAKHFENTNDHFVVIGGIATVFALEVAGLIGRGTKDVDLVVFANPSDEFSARLREYLDIALYQSIEREEDVIQRNYRFNKPINSDCPTQIEIFSVAPLDLVLREGQRIVPFSVAPGLKSLSAILMDDEYLALAKANIIKKSSIPLLNSCALIPLKIQAFLDLSLRKEKGEGIDKKEIQKHKKDIFRLAMTLEEMKYPLPLRIAQNVKQFLEHPQICQTSDKDLRSIVDDPINININKIIGIISEYYDLQ